MSEGAFVEFGRDEAEVVINALYRLRREKDYGLNYLHAFGDRKPWMNKTENEIETINRALMSMGEKIDGNCGGG